MIRPRDLAERFWEKVSKSDGCWIWAAALDARGYGVFQVKRRTQRRAHRIAYELSHGPIPEGAVICHRCDTPACVRPDHLFSGTQRDNVQDMIAKGRRPRSSYPKKRCPRGHEYNRRNARQQICDACKAITYRARKARMAQETA